MLWNIGGINSKNNYYANKLVGGKFMMTVFSLINIILILGMFGISIYGFVLFVKLANRGIKALDIYIEEKTKKDL